MRVVYGANRKKACANYEAKHPGRSTANRHRLLAKKGKTVKPVGRPRKRQFTFNANLLNQNRNMIKNYGIDFVLGDYDDASIYRLKHSRIHRLGVYVAIEDIEPKTVLMLYRGEVVTKAESDILQAQYAAAGEDIYLFSLGDDDDNVVNATKSGNLARFINHSCAPNCELVLNDDVIEIIALCKIKCGTEITIDYHLKTGDRIACNCGADNCRKQL